MARDATARLYDVDEDTVVFKRFHQSKKYDHATINFQARQGKLIELDKLFESIWATRLSGGTRSGLVSLDITVVGQVVTTQNETVLKVSGSDAEFVLDRHQAEEGEAEVNTTLDELRNKVSGTGQVVSLTGRVDGWVGRWPRMLAELRPKPRRILVMDFETTGLETTATQ